MAERSEADEIGATGEAYFDLIMTKTDLLFGKIDPDRLGKDRLIEARLSSWEEGLPYDERSAPLSCAVQIKTVKQTTNRVSLALSVAQRLGHGLLPAFIYIIRLDEDRETIETKVIHIIGEPLRRILTRLRQASKDKLTDLNKSEITFAISDAQCIGMKGRDLKEYLMDEIGPDMDVYVQRKLAERKAGFAEGRPINIKLALSSSSISDIVDASLGLRPLPLAELRAEEERFGISLPKEMFPVNDPDIQVFVKPKAASTCSLTFKGKGECEQVDIKCDVILPWLLPSIPDDQVKALIKSPVLDGTFENGVFKLRLVASPVTRPFIEWVQFFQLLSITSRPEFNITVQQLGHSHDKQVQSPSNPEREQAANCVLDVLHALKEIRSEAGADQDAFVNLEELLSAQDDLLKMASLMTAGPTSTLSFDVLNPVHLEAVERDFVYIHALSLGAEAYALAVRCRVKLENSEESCRATSVSPLKYVDVIELKDFDEDLHRQCKRMFRITDAELSHIWYSTFAGTDHATQIQKFNEEYGSLET